MHKKFEIHKLKQQKYQTLWVHRHNTNRLNTPVPEGYKTKGYGKSGLAHPVPEGNKSKLGLTHPVPEGNTPKAIANRAQQTQFQKGTNPRLWQIGLSKPSSRREQTQGYGKSGLANPVPEGNTPKAITNRA